MFQPLTLEAPAAFDTFALEECPFETVMVDITHRCNMACRNCYIPNRTIADLDRAWLRGVWARLRPKRYVRLVGAEPTVRADLMDLIADVRGAGHHPVLMTNGLKLADRAYTRSLKQAGIQVVYLSMNGGFDDELYDELDGMRCAPQKAEAFANLTAEHVFTSIGMIVARGCNEREVGGLFQACRRARNVRELHLRNIGAIGRFVSDRQLSLDELLDLFFRAAGIDGAAVDTRTRTATSFDFAFERMRVQFTHWPDLASPFRGRLTPDGRVAPFFEHLVANEGGY
jgi:molybdenum cofactor biosynthesis enzyme MoaA